MSDARRVFLALWPDQATREMLNNEAKRLNGPGRSVPRAHLHLTLAFAGTISATQADCIAQEIGTLEQEAFPLTLDRLGHFERARVSWIGPSEAPAALDTLAARARHPRARDPLERHGGRADRIRTGWQPRPLQGPRAGPPQFLSVTGEVNINRP